MIAEFLVRPSPLGVLPSENLLNLAHQIGFSICNMLVNLLMVFLEQWEDDLMEYKALQKRGKVE